MMVLLRPLLFGHWDKLEVWEKDIRSKYERARTKKETLPQGRIAKRGKCYIGKLLEGRMT